MLPSIVEIIPRESEGYSVELFGLSVRLSHPSKGPLRHICGHSNHRTTMVHTCLESATDPDVHPWKRFAIFGRNWRREVGTQTTKFSLLRPISIYSEAFYISASFYMLFAHGDNVRLSDVVSFLTGCRGKQENLHMNISHEFVYWKWTDCVLYS